MQAEKGQRPAGFSQQQQRRQRRPKSRAAEESKGAPKGRQNARTAQPAAATSQTHKPKNPYLHIPASKAGRRRTTPL